MTALLTKGYLILVALFSLVLGFYMMFAPDVNSILLTFYVEEDQKNLTTFIRTISGLFAAGGYILLRFVFSSSRVQLGTVLIYLVGFMLVGKFSGFLYEGISPRSLIIFFILSFDVVGDKSCTKVIPFFLHLFAKFLFSG